MFIENKNINMIDIITLVNSFVIFNNIHFNTFYLDDLRSYGSQL